MKHPIPDAVLQQHIAFLGKTGSGKTSTAKLAVEQIVRGNPAARVCVLDPIKSDWWGLTSSADGRRPGLPFHILGGPRGHVALHDSAGKAIGELVATGALPLSIIDMADFNAGGLQKFFNDFAPALMKKMRGVVYLVMEEAHEFCLSADTEILTKDGFKPHTDINIGTKAVCFDTATGRFSYGPVERVIRHHRSGEMVSLQSDGLDSLSTPDHRVVLRRVQRGVGRYKLYDWTFCQADKVPSCVGVPIGGAPVGAGIADLTLEEARILGWIITDGNIHACGTKTPRLAITQSTATTKCGHSIVAAMDSLLADIEGISRYERKERVALTMGRTLRSSPSITWYFGGNSSARYIELLDGDTNRIPRCIIEDASREQLEALYQGLLEGDGTSFNGRWVRFYPGHNSGLADDFQEVALRLGIATTKNVQVSGQWGVNIANERRMNWVRKPAREHYDGVVWDVTVPTGAFVVRRNGKVFVTGNCPKERSGIGAENLSIHFGKKLATAGRSKGIRMMVLTQRTQALHNALLGSCDTMIAHRLTAPADQLPVKNWLKANVDKEIFEKVSASMSSLKTGSGWICSGEAQVADLVQFPKIATYDNSATPTGEMADLDIKTAAVDRDKLRAIIGDAVVQAEADDPKKLRAEIVRLTALTKAPPNIPQNIPDASIIAASEQRGYERGVREASVASNKELAQFQSVWDRFEGPLADLRNAYVAIVDANEIRVGVHLANFKPSGSPAASICGSSTPTPRPRPEGRPVSKPMPAASGNGGTLTPSLQRVINAIGWWRKIGFDPIERARASVVAGFSPKASTFGVYIAQLVTLGLVSTSQPGKVGLTAEGWNAAVVPEAGTADELYTVARGLLGPQEAKVFDVIYDSYPKEIARKDVADQVGLSPTASTTGVYIAGVAAYGIIEVSSPGHVKAAEWLFP